MTFDSRGSYRKAMAGPSPRLFVSFFEYLEKIELYCSKENYNLGIFKRA